ncbi:MAG TPA: hypothetical protein GXX19_13020 [Syntrophomonadaceae bacterium]|nr:hypothetical protein [Syntrophomonadaceae bacterium]
MPLFILGISQMSREEKASLLAQLNSMTSMNILNEGVQKALHSAKKFTLVKIARMFENLGAGDFARSLEKIDRVTEWNTNVLAAKIRGEMEKLKLLNDTKLWQDIRLKMIDIGGVDASASEEQIAEAVINRVAALYKLDTRTYPNIVAKENAVFEACINDLIEQLQKKLNRMTMEEQDKFRKLLEDEIRSLSKANREAIKEATGLQELSSQALLNFFKTTSGVAFAQMLVGATGFGAFMFLTTTLKAISLLLGVSLPFGVYTVATSVLAFLLSGPFLLLVIALSGGAILYKTNEDLKHQLAKILIVTGRAKLMGC